MTKRILFYPLFYLTLKHFFIIKYWKYLLYCFPFWPALVLDNVRYHWSDYSLSYELEMEISCYKESLLVVE